MSESRPEKYRYWLTYLLDDLPVGAKFSPSVLHVTVIPWFVVEPGAEPLLLDSFKSSFSNIKSFDVVIGDEVSLGPREDVSVLLLKPAQQLFDVHKKALDWIEILGGRWAVKYPYVGDDHIPHIRLRSDTELRRGDKLQIGSLYLVKAIRRADDIREVAAKVVFNG